MIDILFRGKRIDNGKWVYGLLARHNTSAGTSLIVVDDITMIPVWAESVGQYTGLTDYIGNKIFDGDICQDWLRKIFVVKWDKENARFLGYCKDNKIMYVGKEPKVDIIGNIHDNPELIGGTKDE